MIQVINSDMTSNSPWLSVIVPWYDRQELELTLAANHNVFQAYDIEVIVVNCGGDQTWLQSVLKKYAIRHMQSIYIPTLSFNKSLALNVGATFAQSQRLFLLDTDIFVQSELITGAVERLSDLCFVTVDRVLEERHVEAIRGEIAELAYITRIVMANGKEISLETNRIRFSDHSRSGPGLVFVNKKHFLEIGGMNSELKGWGWEDLDLLLRLQLGLGLIRQTYGAVLHYPHQRKLHSANDNISSQNTNFAWALSNYNIGNFLGTIDEDISAWTNSLILTKATNL